MTTAKFYPTRDNLNIMVEFDCPFTIIEDGVLIDAPRDVYAPELYGCSDGTVETVDGWTLLSGYTGQYGYSGPIMHNSEFIGGRLADDILSTPGTYVALICYWLDDEDSDEDETYSEGWAIARLDA
jgi:hypothetical protein